jgi:hypothetical protein
MPRLTGPKAHDERAQHVAGGDDDAVRAVVMRLSRAHPSGGRTIERAAILAAGTDSGAILAWIDSHAGEPEALAPAAAGRGLYSERGAADTRKPLRYLLPSDALA